MPKYVVLAIAVGYTIFITLLSIISLKNIPDLGSSMDDKIYHSGAYTVFVLVWYCFLSKTNIKSKILTSASFALIYGIIIEVVQGVFTTHRQQDISDIYANGIGVLIAVMAIVVFKKIKLN